MRKPLAYSAAVAAVVLVAVMVLWPSQAAQDRPPGDWAAAEAPPPTTGPAERTGGQEPGTTSTTADPAAVDLYLSTWRDAEYSAAFDAFQAAEQAEADRLAAIEAQAEADRQAEAARQAAATTTTTAAPAPAPAPAAAAAYGSGACGGDLPPCYVMMRESGGNITAQNPTSTASGKWQFIDSTWAGFGGYAKARYAPESVQDAKARQLWAGGAGCSHWSAC
jgi:hypothetical protein